MTAKTDIIFVIAHEYATQVASGDVRAVLEGDPDNYDGLQWISETVEKPTMAVLTDLWTTKYQGLAALAQVQAARRPEYPSLADFADAYYWAEKGDPTKMAAYVAKIDAVKAKYPKPAA
ncbi:hypothetical protein [Paramagnetospirillum magneticum]|uniref:Uncharacterized protein n=1 Tax=Paramagnetospirillum magneticum (strain ATCC 700264 / AMB-1) TaxID=342108 RepID=Q2WA41_PARM1|nr:hypothetical protein [Paramagnetospirillum magneticum]BAE49284.1 hypothetical protein amb0480 [Paramagnetospirillum magneticum AMB-1]